MTRPLRGEKPPIDWRPETVVATPELAYGVGACITAFASLEAILGAYLVLIRWTDTGDLVEKWEKRRNTREKRKLVDDEAGAIPNDKVKEQTVQVLDKYTKLAKRRACVAHGFFGVITDREGEFAWRRGHAAAEKTSMGLSASLGEDVPDPETWVYTTEDFEDLAIECSDVCTQIQVLMKVLPVAYALSDPLPNDQEGQ